MAHTVTPSVSEDGTVSYENASVSNSDYREFIGSRGGLDGEDYRYSQETESYRHQYADIDGEELEQRLEGSNADDYFNTLAQSDDRIPGAIQWAANNLPQELIVSFNEALDNDNLAVVHETLEYILAQYSEQVAEQDTEQVEEEDILLTEEEEQVVQAITEQLAQEPPLGNEAADEWESVSEQAAASGDQTYADIASLTSSYHAGQISAEEAINWVFQNHNIQDIARVYQHINGG